MNINSILQSGAQWLQPIVAYVLANPLETLAALILAVIAFRVFVAFYRYLYVLLRARSLVYLKITLPREDSQKDKEKSEEKDFREKLSIMEQLYRNLYEISG